MINIIKIIKDLREEGLDDEKVLTEVMDALPDKKSAFQEAIKRGATPKQILDKIILDNEEQEKEELEKEIEKEKKQKKESQEKKQIQEKEKENIDLERPEPELELASDPELEPELEQDPELEPELEPDLEEEDSVDEGNLKKKKGGIKGKLRGIKGSRFFGEFFAVTRYLLVGVDISDHSIEILLLDKDGSVVSYGRSILDEGIIFRGEVLESKKLTDALKKGLSTTKPHPLDIPEHTRKQKVSLKKKNHKAIVSLPEAKTYVYLFSFPDRSNIYSKIEEKMKQTIPFSHEDLYWDFKEVCSDKKGVRVLFVAAQRDVVDSYIYFFKSANIDPVAFDIEGTSIGRALLPTKNVYDNPKRRKIPREVMADGKSRMIVDLGAMTTTISLYNEDALLVASVPLPYAGSYFTKKVADHFKISLKEADEKKQKEGFDTNGSTYEVLKPHGQKIIKEITEAISYYKREFDKDIKEVILAGGTALLPQILPFFEKELEEVTVKMGDPLKKIEDFGALDKKEAILYSNVVGLARRALLTDPIKDGINLLPEEVKNQEKKSQTEKQRSVLLVALFIAISGVMFLGLAVYYLIYLPVPAPIQPLKQRVLLFMDDSPGMETIDVVTIRSDIEEVIYIYKGPGEAQDVIAEAMPGERYRATTQLSGWWRIVVGDTEGWVKGEFLEDIRSITIKEGETDIDFEKYYIEKDEGDDDTIIDDINTEDIDADDKSEIDELDDLIDDIDTDDADENAIE